MIIDLVFSGWIFFFVVSVGGCYFGLVVFVDGPMFGYFEGTSKPPPLLEAADRRQTLEPSVARVTASPAGTLSM